MLSYAEVFLPTTKSRFSDSYYIFQEKYKCNYVFRTTTFGREKICLEIFSGCLKTCVWGYKWNPDEDETPRKKIQQILNFKLNSYKPCCFLFQTGFYLYFYRAFLACCVKNLFKQV